MIKIKKLLTSPIRYFINIARINELNKEPKRYYLIGFDANKKLIEEHCSQLRIIFIDKDTSAHDFKLTFEKDLIMSRNNNFIVFNGTKLHKFYQRPLYRHSINFHQYEDNGVEKLVGILNSGSNTTNIKIEKSTVPKLKPKPKPNGSSTVPNWFNQYASLELVKRTNQSNINYLYMPWIQGHGDALIRKLEANNYNLIEFPIINSIEDITTRRSVSRFARDNPVFYKKLVIKTLIDIKDSIDGFIFTFDWTPAMRLIVDACKELDIPTILVSK